MTADPYVRDRAGKFARLPAPLYRDCPPIPEPQRVPEATEPTADNPIVQVGPGRYRVYAPKCRHDRFLHYARNNCCKESDRAR